MSEKVSHVNNGRLLELMITWSLLTNRLPMKFSIASNYTIVPANRVSQFHPRFLILDFSESLERLDISQNFRSASGIRTLFVFIDYSDSSFSFFFSVPFLVHTVGIE